MIVRMTNKDEDFYNYMGKFFGSRIVQSETKDRIYDDNFKVWYIYLDDNNKVCSFVSVLNNVIKNIYSTSDMYLEELLLYVKQHVRIAPSIITRVYEDIYLNCGFKVTNLDNYKHFVMIRGEENE